MTLLTTGDSVVWHLWTTRSMQATTEKYFSRAWYKYNWYVKCDSFINEIFFDNKNCIAKTFLFATYLRRLSSLWVKMIACLLVHFFCIILTCFGKTFNYCQFLLALYNLIFTLCLYIFNCSFFLINRLNTTNK